MPPSALLAGVTNLALGLGFLYLWWSILRRRYVLLMGVARLLQIPQHLLLALNAQSPGQSGLGDLASLSWALSTVLLAAACYDFVYRRLPTWPLLGLAVALVLWRAVAPQLTADFLLQELPASMIRAGILFWTAWVIVRGPRLRVRGPLAAFFVLTGLHALDYPFVADLPWGVTLGLAVSSFNAIGLSVFLLILVLEESRGQARRAEEGRLDSEERYRAVFEHAAVGLAEVALDGRFLSVNRRLCEMMGYSSAELLERNVLDVTYRDDVAADREYIRQLGTGSDVYRREKRYVVKAGGILWAHLTIAVVRGPDGTPKHFVTVVQDITERKLAEQERRAADERFRMLVETMSEGLIVTDLEERIEYVNERFCTLLGYRREELVGKTTFDLLASEADAETVRLKTAERREGAADQYEIGLRARSGDVVWMLVSGAPLRDSAGNVVGTIGANTSITERKRAELRQAAVYRIAQAADHAAQLDDLFRSVHSIVQDVMSARNFYIALYDAESGELSFPYWVDERDPPPLPRVGGRGLSEYVLRTGKPLLATVAVGAELERLDEIAASGSSSQVWLGVPLIAGEEGLGVMAVQDYLDPLAYSERDLQVFEFVSSQVAKAVERKRVEVARARLQADVERSALEWRRTFDAIDSPILLLDASGRVSRLNAAAAALTGRSYAEVAGRGLEALETGEPWQTAVELVREAIQNRHSGWGQVSSDTQARTWDVQATPVTEGEGGLILVMRDITPLIRLQESLRRSETMSAMGALVAGVAHEVRNPLFSMTATLDAFEARAKPSAGSHQHLEVLRRQLARLTSLMEDLLQYGRPATLELAPEAIPVVVGQAAESCAVLADTHDVVVRTEFPVDLPPVLADRKRLVQVFVNLLSNAIHYSPRGGSITLRGELVSRHGGEWLDCTVRDEGPGFSPEDLPRAFEPFFTRRRGGTGLGLALVQRIVEQHGGRVVAENRAEGGAAVCVRLPAGQRLGW